nr:MAG TPA: hypothetical protein [Caudoviricetes sp.]
MKVIEVTEKEVKAAFDAAKSDEVKNVLAALFCKPEDRIKPSLDDYKSIKTYEDACEALGEEPVGDLGDHVDKHIIALIKLETISRALWGKDWQPKPDPDGSKYFYYPWFALYTQSEMDSMSEEDRGALLGAPAGNGARAGFGSLGASDRSSDSYATIGFRLCQETEEKAKYFGIQFKEIWADYLAFNFTVEK